jgi:hypothetical protein
MKKKEKATLPCQTAKFGTVTVFGHESRGIFQLGELGPKQLVEEEQGNKIHTKQTSTTIS